MIEYAIIYYIRFKEYKEGDYTLTFLQRRSKYINYKIIKAEKDHVANIISIFNEVYTEAVQANSILPFTNKDDLWVKRFTEWFNKGLGVIALKDDKIVGYIIGLPVKEFFGSDDGIFVPWLFCYDP